MKIIILLLLLPFTSHTQQINRDSLLQIIRDTTISQQKRQKAGAEIITYNKLLLKPYLSDTSSIFLDTIREKIRVNHRKEDELINILIHTVFDTTKSIEVRKETIDLLADLNDKKALMFLVNNIGNIYFPSSYFTADSEFKPYYIFLSLSTRKTKDKWLLAPMIIQSLHLPKSDTDILLLAMLTQQIFVDKTLMRSFINGSLPAYYHNQHPNYTNNILYDNRQRMNQYF